MKELTIGEAARQAGVSSSTLRYYETIGILPPPSRSSGQRRYGPDALKPLAVVQLAKETGFTLAEIRTLLDGVSGEAKPPGHWKQMARTKIEELESTISRMNAMKTLLEFGLECDCLGLDECVSVVQQASARKNGLR